MDKAMKYRIKNKKLAELVYSVFEEEDVQRMIAKQIEEADFDPIILCSYDDFDKFGNLATKVKPEYEGLDNKRCSVSIFINEEEIEKIREYVSDDWNPYPQLKPPVRGKYLIQIPDSSRKIGFFVDLLGWDGSESVEKTWDLMKVVAFMKVPDFYYPKDE